MKENYTLSVYSSNCVGMLARICTLFTRRHLNIESLTVSESEIENIHRYTIVVNCTKDVAKQICKQLEKQIEIYKALVSNESEVLHQELALYKLQSRNLNAELSEWLIKDKQARFLSVDPEFMVIEKIGTKEEMQEFLVQLKPFGVMEYVRSGRVSVSKPFREMVK